MLQDCTVLRIHPAGHTPRIETTRGPLKADSVLLSAGAWSGQISVPEGLPPLPLFPVRGQMLALQKPAWWPWSGSIRSPHVYYVARKSGELLIGASVEHTDFNCETTEEMRHHFIRAAVREFPGLRGLEVSRHWAGLRPATPDELPVLGALGAPSERLSISTGHHRNGILLAPLTARVMADLLLGQDSLGMGPALEPFSPSRFGKTSTIAGSPR